MTELPSFTDNSVEAIEARREARDKEKKEGRPPTKGGVPLGGEEKSQIHKQDDLGAEIGRLSETILRFEEGLARGRKVGEEALRLQKENLEMLVEGGYDAFVSTEDAQVAIDPRLFETQPPAWYRNLSEEWQEAIRARTAILMGCYPKRARGHLDLAIMAENADVRIDRDALDFMWREMPGFRVATATIINDIFEIRREIPSGLPTSEENTVFLMVLKDEARKKEEGVLDKFAEYKKQLISKLEEYFKNNPKLLECPGGPQISPKSAARGAVAAVWNLFFVGNAVDSGDQGDLTKLEELQRKPSLTEDDLKNNPTVGRRVKNPIIYAEQARAMMLPYDKAWSKTFRKEGKVGTEETWLGNLGDYVAERMKHNDEFKREFAQRTRRIIPQRLFASWFDLTTFEEGKEEISVGKKLCEAKKTKIAEGLYDFVNPQSIKFSELSSSELWGGYADTWDSAKKIYEMIGGKFPLKQESVAVWRQTLATCLAKLRNTNLAPYFKDPEIIVSCIAGSVGLVRYTNEYLLVLPEEHYDVLANSVLADDRLFYEMKGGRKYILDEINACDHYSLKGFLSSMIVLNRRGIRTKASLEAKKWQK